MPCYNIITKAEIAEFPNCCGICVIGEFMSVQDAMVDSYDYTTWPYKTIPAKPLTKKAAIERLREYKTLLAATTPDQKGAIAALKAVGFKKVTTTPSNEGRYAITLWMWKKPRRQNARVH